METWQLQEAKNKLSELVERALRGEPQMITRHGKPAVVVQSAEEYDKAHAETKKNFIEFLLNMPKVLDDGDDELFARINGSARDVDL